ncbi:calcium/calmodulin-regulated receptor-like kinase 1 isoform X2 [Aristolochia californica]|uniref:calcium/calmodulin-regulated receptor-like kinase 1 isoform X2 n=1 Tax=Aristolochia californica TaxID=171875 RepID=UPI0035E227B7
MKGVSWGLIVGISIGVIIGVLLAILALFFIRLRKKRSQIGNSSSRRAATIPIRTNGADSCTTMSDSTIGPESPKESDVSGTLWLEGAKRKNIVSVSGIPKYSYKDLQKATSNFTTVLGQGAFGPVYKAQMSTGETVAVKVLATNSKQGEREFQTEVLLLGRLHHRNLVNLVGYCAEKGQHMLVYVYMSNGSLASHLYNEGEKHDPLSWNLRVYIALDVARGLEYLHDGAVPPVIHRDIKSSNILLDRSMRARVADFGLSREEMVNPHMSNIRGTFGYLDPEYVSSRAFTKKSDVYSFGILLFELIAGRVPQQGLLEYVELGALNAEGKTGWEEIADSRLNGDYDVQELNEMAALAYRCINRSSRKRPFMRDVVQALSRIIKLRHNRKHHKPSLPITLEEVAVDMEQAEVQTPVSELQREESMESMTGSQDV